MAWIRDEDFDKIFERIFKQMNLDEQNSRSWSYGYSITTGPDGEPVIREWGTGLPNEDNPLKPKPFIPETPEPLTQIDIDQHNMQVRVIVEMPGFTKESIKITGREDKIQLSANDGTRQIDTEIPINARIDPKTAKATYNNGVLDITITLLEAPKSDNVDIKIN